MNSVIAARKHFIESRIEEFNDRLAELDCDINGYDILVENFLRESKNILDATTQTTMDELEAALILAADNQHCE